MALLLVDGFDYWAAGDAPNPGWVFDARPQNFTTNTTPVPRYGHGRCLLTTSAGGGMSGYRSFTPSGAIIFGFAYLKRNAFPSGSSCHVASLHEDGVVHFRLFTDDIGRVFVQRGTTTVATSTYRVFPFEWLFIEVKVTVADSGGTIDVRVDGEAIISFTGDTRNAGTTGLVNRLYFVGSSTGGGANTYDDLYICNDAGPVNNDFLGDVRVATLMPNGVGTHSDLVPNGAGANYTKVNSPLPDDSTLVASDTPGAKDSYALEDLPTSAYVVKGIQTLPRLSKSDAGAISARRLLRIDSTDHVGSDLTLSTTAGYHPEVIEENPDTAAAWDGAAIQSLEAGIEVRS